MKADPRAQRLLDMLALQSGNGPEPVSIDARRAGFSALMQMGAKPRPVAEVAELFAAGRIRLRLYRASTVKPQPALVFFHGGGLVAGSIETHDGICRALCASSGVTVISVGYRLAPEHKFPAGLEDAALAFDWIAGHADELGIDATRTAIGGESAGALLATLISHGWQKVNAIPKAQLLLCPVIDLTGKTLSRRIFAKGFLIEQTVVAQDIGHCLADGMTATDLPSPLRIPAARTPPHTIIVAAECDPFRDEALLYTEILRSLGVQIQHSCEPGMIHSFYGLPALLPQVGICLDAAGRQLAELLA